MNLERQHKPNEMLTSIPVTRDTLRDGTLLPKFALYPSFTLLSSCNISLAFVRSFAYRPTMCEAFNHADHRSVDRIVAVVHRRLVFERRAHWKCRSNEVEIKFGGCASAKGITSIRLQAIRDRQWRMWSINKQRTGTSAGSAFGAAGSRDAQEPRRDRAVSWI